MRIKVLTTFLDGKDRFEKDDERTVENERGARFVAAGWAKSLSGDMPVPVELTDEQMAQAKAQLRINAEAVGLDIHNSTLGVTSAVKGA